MRKLGTLLGTLILCGAAQAQTVDRPARTITGVVKQSAIVESVDPITRQIKLIGADNRRFSITAGDEVVNFDQIEPRDRLVVEYIERLRIEVSPPGTEQPEGAVAAVGVAEPGDKPGVGGAETVQMSFTVGAIDRENDQATLIDTDGIPHTVAVQDPESLKLVQVGDIVTTRLTKAMSISVEPPPTASSDET